MTTLELINELERVEDIAPVYVWINGRQYWIKGAQVRFDGHQNPYTQLIVEEAR
jgi:hypothetical protein